MLQRTQWRLTETRRAFVDSVAKQLGIVKPEDWYNVSVSQLRESGGTRIIDYYKRFGLLGKNNVNPLVTVLRDIYPQHQWLCWKFRCVPSGFWNNLNNQRECLEWLAKELDVKSKEDWYRVKHSQVLDKGLLRLLQLYNGSLSAALTAVYPEYKWLPWKFVTVADGWWDSLTNQRTFFDWLAKQLDIKQLDDWYSAKITDVKKNGGATVLEHYGGSLRMTLCCVYPEHNWHLWKFTRVVDSFWSDIRNQRQYLDWLAEECGFKDLNDWYHVKPYLVYEHGGHGLLSHYGGSLQQALSTVYPDHDWQFWKHSPYVTRTYWNFVQNQRKYFDWLATKLNVKELDDWYNVRPSEVNEPRFKFLISKYDGSFQKALSAIYPEHDWKFWLFEATQKGIWNSGDRQYEYFKWLEQQLDIQHPSDWYRVSTQDVLFKAGRSFLGKHNGLAQVLAKFYPDYQFQHQSNRKKTQQLLTKYTTEIFPSAVIPNTLAA